MSTLREAGEKALAFMESRECHHESTHRGGVLWTICDDCGRKWADDEGGFVEYREPVPIAALRAALSAPAADGWQLVPVKWTDEQAYHFGRGAYECSVLPAVGGRNAGAFGQLTAIQQAGWIAKAAMLASAPRPAPAEPQPSQEGEAYCGMSFTQAKAKILALPLDDAHALAISLLIQNRMLLKAPAPQPAGGEPQPAAQQERKPLTDEQIDRHSIAAADCPPSSTVILVSSLRRLLSITATKGDSHA